METVIIEADTTIKIGGGVCFTLGGTRQVPIVLESNQNNATAKETEVCTTLPASMGLGGGYVPMIVDTLVFDEGQITCPENGNRPTWGGAATLYPGTQVERS